MIANENLSQYLQDAVNTMSVNNTNTDKLENLSLISRTSESAFEGLLFVTIWSKATAYVHILSL